MINAIELIMLVALIAVFVMATISDCRHSLIPNKLILVALCFFSAVDVVYYLFFARGFFSLFLSNLIGTTLIAWVFYAYHIWAAGDSKLFFITALAIPSRYLTYINLGPVPCFLIIIVVFSVAFLYVIADSLYLGIKSKTLFRFSWHKPNVLQIVVSYFFSVGAIYLCNMIIALVFGTDLFEKRYLITAIDFVLLITFFQIREKISNRIYYIMTAVMWALLIILQANKVIVINLNVDIRSWLIVLAVMLFRLIGEKYNYQEVSVKDLKPRMIPALISIAAFSRSRVQGLPQNATEDLRARLTESEIEAIQKWSKTKNGKPSIIVVRKIPFAIFIFIGTIGLLLIEGAALCHLI